MSDPTERQEQTDMERWLEKQLAKAPPWTPERIARLAEALGYDPTSPDGKRKET